jgi:hypothetical protein
MHNINELYARLDEVRMTPADRQLAKASLAQADALATFILAAVAFLARLVTPRPNRAHWRA